MTRHEQGPHPATLRALIVPETQVLVPDTTRKVYEIPQCIDQPIPISIRALDAFLIDRFKQPDNPGFTYGAILLKDIKDFRSYSCSSLYVYLDPEKLNIKELFSDRGKLRMFAGSAGVWWVDMLGEFEELRNMLPDAQEFYSKTSRKKFQENWETILLDMNVLPEAYDYLTAIVSFHDRIRKITKQRHGITTTKSFGTTEEDQQLTGLTDETKDEPYLDILDLVRQNEDIFDEREGEIKIYLLKKMYTRELRKDVQGYNAKQIRVQ